MDDNITGKRREVMRWWIEMNGEVVRMTGREVVRLTGRERGSEDDRGRRER